jgi:Flp pilus assembly pilin Flp
MNTFLERTRRLIRGEEGPTATEYATLLGIIAAGVIFAMSNFGDKVYVIYVQLRNALTIS